MGTWNNLQEGFTVNERLPDTLVDVAVCTSTKGTNKKAALRNFGRLQGDNVVL
ncbi:hypothetical protein [Levilactobacillus brevis]|uniref:hypothetical protein n=1 Tax=Levilactobacillus brevis TaxID=1580 RepID=UPI0022E506B4|nr:hypothetical protein [Levilactobacillus brevis]